MRRNALGQTGQRAAPQNDAFSAVFRTGAAQLGQWFGKVIGHFRRITAERRLQSGHSQKRRARAVLDCFFLQRLGDLWCEGDNREGSIKPPHSGKSCLCDADNRDVRPDPAHVLSTGVAKRRKHDPVGLARMLSDGCDNTTRGLCAVFGCDDQFRPECGAAGDKVIAWQRDRLCGIGDALRCAKGCVGIDNKQTHHRITDGSQSEMAGKRLMSKSATSIAPMNISIDGMILAIEIFAMAQVISTTDATGGVC